MQVFHHESCHVFPLFPYHNHFWNNLVEFFYHEDTVDSSFVWHVVFDNTRNCDVHKVANYYLVFFTKIICFRNYYILSNRSHMTISFWPDNNNSYGIFLFKKKFHVHQYFLKGLMNCSIHFYCCCCSWKS